MMGMRNRWIPREMLVAPRLDWSWYPTSICQHDALLISPFNLRGL